MIVTLYTTRVVLKSLGVEDYGIFNVVGGVVLILMSINVAMSGSSSRFTSYALGQNDKELCERTFSTIIYIHWILAGIILLVSETIGLWFVIEKLNIPEGRQMAAMVCYQSSVIVSLISIVCVPYNALIIGHERMAAYAYISIIEVLLRLLVAFLLIYSSSDRLILYSLLLICSSFIVFLCYKFYCRRNFSESHYKYRMDRPLFRQIATFSGWVGYGHIACAGYTHGINILMNIFFGPAVNAARSVSVQVQNGARILATNFNMAVRPQIVKNWVQGDIDYMHNLVIYSSKFSFFLTSLMVFPLLVSIKPILEIWLVEVPDHTVAFIRIILYMSLLESFNNALIESNHATGDVKKFQIWESIPLLLVLPVSYLFLHYYHISPEEVMMIYFFSQFVAQFVRIFIVLPQIHMSYKKYFLKVFPRVILVFFVLIIPSMYVNVDSKASVGFTLAVLLLSILVVLATIYFVGLSKKERDFVHSFVREKFNKIR
ncbi:MAG: MATE family efflux transporter [Alistipes sp.]|nr:MATE family efflux transporter [Candidatus Alistipes equi]